MAASSKTSSVPRIKQDSGVSSVRVNSESSLPTQRLTSLRLPRDLTLGGLNPSRITKPNINKKVYTPNLNVVRNKNTDVKTSKDTTVQSGRGGRGGIRGDRGGRSDRGANRGRGRGAGTLVQTAGLFSEGTGAVQYKKVSGSGYRASEDTPNNIKRPTYIKREVKIDADTEKNEIQMILGDDEDEDASGESAHSEGFVPIGLSETKSEIKDVNKLFGVTQENNKLDLYPNTSDELFQRTEPQLILIQLPDSLPGQCFTVDPSNGQSSEQASETIVNNNCTMKQLNEGLVGKIVRYKSGKTKLVLGQTRFDMELGIEPGLLQEAMSVNTNSTERSGSLINLGHINAKLSATPDWEYMLTKRSTLKTSPSTS